MRINKFVALATGMSRRAADTAVETGKVLINNTPATAGATVSDQDTVTLDGKVLSTPAHTTVILHKPIGYVVSRNGQGSKTIYDLLPDTYHALKPVGRLDKDSSGLLLLTNDGERAHALTHPSSQKTKVYSVTLDKTLQPLHHQMLVDFGVQLDDGPSKFLEMRRTVQPDTWIIVMHEGRNRQIRRTCGALGYTVTRLHRTHFGQYALGDLKSGEYVKLN